MTIESILATQSANLGSTFPDIVLFILLCACFIFFAMTFRLGLVLTFLALGSLYVVFIEWGMPTHRVLGAFLIILVVLSLSMFVSMSKKGSSFIS